MFGIRVQDEDGIQRIPRVQLTESAEDSLCTGGRMGSIVPRRSPPKTGRSRLTPWLFRAESTRCRTAALWTPRWWRVWPSSARQVNAYRGSLLYPGWFSRSPWGIILFSNSTCLPQNHAPSGHFCSTAILFRMREILVSVPAKALPVTSGGFDIGTNAERSRAERSGSML